MYAQKCVSDAPRWHPPAERQFTGKEHPAAAEKLTPPDEVNVGQNELKKYPAGQK